jgi:hypothetical protein
MSITKLSDNITPSLGKIKNGLPLVQKQAFNKFVSLTPKKSGNARQRTKLVGDSIFANYPYATRLDNGYSSQAPQGMTKQTIEYFKQLLKRLIRK